jgi:dihydrolipoamide dehydrogenase
MCERQGVALYKETPMGMALRAEHGFAKVLVDRESRKILGFHVIGSDASKLVHEVIPVITMGGRMDDILKCIHIHPAMNEVVRDAFREARDAFIEQKLDIPDDIRYK